MTNLFSNIFSSLSEFFGLQKEIIDPENRRLRTIEEVDKELDSLRKERDQLVINFPKNPSEEIEHARKSGAIANRIIFLRHKRDSLKK